MKPNRLREAIAAGRLPVGHMIQEFGSRGIAKIAESADLDFVLLDMEHTAFDTAGIADMIAWFKATPVAPIVRVPGPLYHFLARIMDAGALGVMVPNVENAAQARAIVDAVKYAPLGRRGVGLGTSHTDYIAPDPARYFAESNANTVVICQIESVEGVNNAEAIAAVDGVDILWVGHYDLSQSMGIPGQFDNPAFLDNLNRVIKAARKHGRALGVQPNSPEQAQGWMLLGFNVISWGNDIGVYRNALAAAVAQLRDRASHI